MVRKWSSRSCAAPALTNPLVVSGLQQYGSGADDQLLQPTAVPLRSLVKLFVWRGRAATIRSPQTIEQLRLEMSEVPNFAHFAIVERSGHYRRLGKVATVETAVSTGESDAFGHPATVLSVGLREVCHHSFLNVPWAVLESIDEVADQLILLLEYSDAWTRRFSEVSVNIQHSPDRCGRKLTVNHTGDGGRNLRHCCVRRSTEVHPSGLSVTGQVPAGPITLTPRPLFVGKSNVNYPGKGRGRVVLNRR